jgi:hypothetical protein
MLHIIRARVPECARWGFRVGCEVRSQSSTIPGLSPGRPRASAPRSVYRCRPRHERELARLSAPVARLLRKMQRRPARAVRYRRESKVGAARAKQGRGKARTCRLRYPSRRHCWAEVARGAAARQECARGGVRRRAIEPRPALRRLPRRVQSGVMVACKDAKQSRWLGQGGSLARAEGPPAELALSVPRLCETERPRASARCGGRRTRTARRGAHACTGSPSLRCSASASLSLSCMRWSTGCSRSSSFAISSPLSLRTRIQVPSGSRPSRAHGGGGGGGRIRLRERPVRRRAPRTKYIVLKLARESDADIGAGAKLRWEGGDIDNDGRS